MTKNLTINCDRAIILRDRENILEQYDSIMINCDGVTIADDLQAKAFNANVMFNCDNVNTIASPKNPLRINGLVTLDTGSEYRDVFLVSDDAIITPEGVSKIEEMEGMIALDALYYPQSAGSLVAKVQAGKAVSYPDDAQVVLGDAWLDAKGNKQWLPQTKYYIAGTIYALDADTLRKLKTQGTTFHCPTLYLYEGMQQEFGSMFASEKTLLVPDGYAVVTESQPVMDLYASYGDRIYLLGNLTIQPRDRKHLQLFQSIIVKGTVDLPMDSLKECKAVVTADKVHVFEGELMKINGFQTISRAMLLAAKDAGTQYTIDVNGFALFDGDVTPEDVKVIVTMKINGGVSAPSATHAHLNAVSGKINGMMLGSIAEIKAMLESTPGDAGNVFGGMLPEPIAKMLGIETGNEAISTIFNADNYTLL